MALATDVTLDDGGVFLWGERVDIEEEWGEEGGGKAEDEEAKFAGDGGAVGGVKACVGGDGHAADEDVVEQGTLGRCEEWF